MNILTFKGGYRFKGFTGRAANKLITLDLPSTVRIPLRQGFGSTLTPKVGVGDGVKAGQIIAQDDKLVSSPIHSSVNGTVTKIEKVNYFKRSIDMVTIESDGDPGYEKLAGATKEWEKLPNQEIEELIYKSGASSLNREGIPTSFKSSIINSEEVVDLIIHGISSEAYNASLKTLLEGKNLYNFVEGIKILKKIMPKARIHLALNSRKKDIIESVKKLTSNIEGLKIHALYSKYPQGYDEVLIPTILGKKFPYGYSAANIGIVVLMLQTVLHVYDAVVRGKPLIERILAFCGQAFKENLHVKVRVGSSLADILKDRLFTHFKHRVVLNSLLTGVELADLSLPISREFSQIIAIRDDDLRRFLNFMRPGFHSDSYSNTFISQFVKVGKIATTNLRGDQRPCIQCGYCSEVCPVDIMPTVLDRYIKLGINETLMRFGIFNCIECNLCSYICPSKIHLANNLKDAKTKLIEAGCDNSLCILPKFNLKGLDDYKGVKNLR